VTVLAWVIWDLLLVVMAGFTEIVGAFCGFLVGRKTRWW
jgi:hypothetical protein